MHVWCFNHSVWLLPCRLLNGGHVVMPGQLAAPSPTLHSRPHPASPLPCLFTAPPPGPSPPPAPAIGAPWSWKPPPPHQPLASWWRGSGAPWTALVSGEHFLLCARSLLGSMRFVPLTQTLTQPHSGHWSTLRNCCGHLNFGWLKLNTVSNIVKKRKQNIECRLMFIIIKCMAK